MGMDHQVFITSLENAVSRAPEDKIIKWAEAPGVRTHYFAKRLGGVRTSSKSNIFTETDPYGFFPEEF
jgi:hypothetical protein